MKPFAVMHPAAMVAPHEVTQNSPLKRMIEESMNPYHALHVAKAFQLKAAKPKAISQVAAVPNSPWLMMKARQK